MHTHTHTVRRSPSVRPSVRLSVYISICMVLYVFFVCLRACSMHASKNISTHYICDKGNKHVHSITQINQIINLLKDSLMILETDPHDCTNSQHVSSKQFNCCCLAGWWSRSSYQYMLSGTAIHNYIWLYMYTKTSAAPFHFQKQCLNLCPGPSRPLAKQLNAMRRLQGDWSSCPEEERTGN